MANQPRSTRRMDSCAASWWRQARTGSKCDIGQSRSTGARPSAHSASSAPSQLPNMLETEQHISCDERAGSRLNVIAWPALLLVIYIGSFWKLVLANQYTWLDGTDYAYQVLPWYQFQAGEWHR